MTKKIEVFASEALPGELEEFPDIKRGWGTTKESTGGIPPMKWFNAIQKRTDEVINSIIEVSVKTVIDYGVKGDGSDESVALQDAINSGVVNVPDGMEVSFSNITIPKGTVFNLGSGSILRSLELDAMKFEQDVKYLVNPSDVGTSTLIKLQKQLPDGTKFIKVYRPYDQSQQWYDENSTDTTKLGYTADVYKIASIEGNIVTLQSPMEFELDDSSFVTLVNGYTTKFYGGIIASETTGRYMLAQWNVSDVAWYGTTFKHAKAGIRFNNATNIHWHNCIFNTETNSSSIALNYGTTDCSVTNSIFNGGLVEDAQFITFSGCRRIHSVRNKYYTDSDNAMLSGFYIGAKPWEW